jgi:electron transport complex protein RnfB
MAMLDASPDVIAIARIDEATCIGCTLCIQACPTDAIVGAAKLMHTVIASRCTGCRLCLPPCPVDCIAMLPAARPRSSVDADRARRHASARDARLASDARKRPSGSAPQNAPQNVLESAPGDAARQRRRTAVAAALARARSRRAPRSVNGA